MRQYTWGAKEFNILPDLRNSVLPVNEECHGNSCLKPDDKATAIKVTSHVKTRNERVRPRRRFPILPLARRFRANTRGVTAIEFAIVAPILFIMLLGILEISFYFLAGDILESATANASRKLMIAQVSSLAPTDVCKELMIPNMFKCASLQVNVTSAKCFSTLAGSGGTTGSGAPGDAVMVEARYPWLGLGGFALALAGARRSLVLRSVSVFRNPPDSSTPSSTC